MTGDDYLAGILQKYAVIADKDRRGLLIFYRVNYSGCQHFVKVVATNL
jgi:hypothetical protein